MANVNGENLRHFILEGVTETEAFRPRVGGGGRSTIPYRDRNEHASLLLEQIDGLRTEAAALREAQALEDLDDGLGIQVEFEGFPDIELAFESLARERQRIELLNVRTEENRTHATVFVPDGKLDHFEKLVRDYLVRKQDRAGRVRDNQRLIDAIRRIRSASLRALWTDAPEAFPSDESDQFWWEAWLPVRRERSVVVERFRRFSRASGIETSMEELVFPERTVVLALASAEQMKRSALTLNHVAELRRAKDTAEFFGSLEPNEQREWLEDLLARTQFESTSEVAPHVCMLDTGVNRGHPFLSSAIARNDLHTVDPAWGTRGSPRSRYGDGRFGSGGRPYRCAFQYRAPPYQASTGVGETSSAGWSRGSLVPAPRSPYHRGCQPTRGLPSNSTSGLLHDRFLGGRSRQRKTVILVSDARRTRGGRLRRRRTATPFRRIRREFARLGRLVPLPGQQLLRRST